MKMLKALWDGITGSNPGLGRVMDFGVAFGLVTAATLLNLLAWPAGSDEDGHYFALVAAVIISALSGGFWPGLAATVLAGLSSAYFTLSPQFSLAVAVPHAADRLTLFLAEGGLLSLAGSVIRNQRMIDVQNVGVQRYLVIPITVAAATLLKLLLPDLARQLPFAFNYAAICLCAWSGGFVSGLAATALLTGLTRYFFLEPVHSLAVSGQAEAVRVALFVGEGLLLAVLGGAYTKVKGLAENFRTIVRAHLAAASSIEENTETIRAISRDTIWEWELDTGEIIRTPSWSGSLAIVLPTRELFDSWVERIHPADRDATVSRLQRAIEEGREELQYTYRLLLPSGKPLSVSDHAFVVRGDDWKPLRVIGRSAELPVSNVER